MEGNLITPWRETQNKAFLLAHGVCKKPLEPGIPIPLCSMQAQGQDSPSSASTFRLIPVSLSFLLFGSLEVMGCAGGKHPALGLGSCTPVLTREPETGLSIPCPMPSPAGCCTELDHDSYCPQLLCRKTRNTPGVLGREAPWEDFCRLLLHSVTCNPPNWQASDLWILFLLSVWLWQHQWVDAHLFFSFMNTWGTEDIFTESN